MQHSDHFVWLKFCKFANHVIIILFYSYSTPKSTRYGLSSTPAPEASPVLSIDGATPRSMPFEYEGTAQGEGKPLNMLADLTKVRKVLQIIERMKIKYKS